MLSTGFSEARVASYAASTDTLLRAVGELTTACSIGEIMLVLRGAAREILRADGATFVLREGELCYYADEDAISPLWKGQRFPMSACISGWVMLRGRPVVIPDIYKDARIPADAYRPTFVRSLAMVPVRRRSPVAALGNYWAQEHAADDVDVVLLHALADATSVALQRIGFC